MKMKIRDPLSQQQTGANRALAFCDCNCRLWPLDPGEDIIKKKWGGGHFCFQYKAKEYRQHFFEAASPVEEMLQLLWPSFRQIVLD